MKKKVIKKLIKQIDSLEDLKMQQEFYTLLNFNFIMIYTIHTTSV